MRRRELWGYIRNVLLASVQAVNVSNNFIIIIIIIIIY
jgi:hypothetical protein